MAPELSGAYLFAPILERIQANETNKEIEQSMRPFLPNPAKRIFTVSASLAASLGSLCSISLLAGGAVTMSTLLSAQSAFAVDKPVDMAMPGEIMLLAPSGVSASRVAELASAAKCDVVANLSAPSPYYLLRLKSASTSATSRAAGNTTQQPAIRVGVPSAEVLAAIAVLQDRQPDIHAEPNYVRRTTRRQAATPPTVTPDDTFYGEQWDKRMINMPAGWALQVGTRPVVVADIDTGFDVGHPDFFRNGVPVYIDPISTATGLVSTLAADVVSVDGHGVHTAGTIAAVTNNGVGVTGVAGYDGFGVNIKLLPIKASITVTIVTTGQPDQLVEVFPQSALVLGIQEAVKRGAVAINMSLGGYSSSFIEANAIANAISAGTTIVASAGNDAQSGDTLPSYPANYPGVINVSAVNNNAKLASYSNYGGTVTIAAPGGDFNGGDADIPNTRILSTFPRSFATNGTTIRQVGYAYEQGTSMACPQVTGTVALLAAAGASQADMARTLIASATTLPDPGIVNIFGDPVTTKQAYGAGLLNVGRALLPRISFVGGDPLTISAADGSKATDLGSSYFRTRTFDTSVVALGNLVKEISSNAAQSSFTFRLETATTPAAPVQNVTFTSSLLPTLATGESSFTTKNFALPVPPVRLGAGKYKATATMSYRGYTNTQIQYFEVQDYTQTAGLALFSVPFKPATTTNGISPEQQVLGISSGFAVRRFDPLNPVGSDGSGYFLYQPSTDTVIEQSYARFSNQFHSADTLHADRVPTPLAFNAGSPTASIAPIGVGFWMNLSEARLITTDGTPTISSVGIPLYGVEDSDGNFRGISGWNLIGAPFEFPVNWSAVTVRIQTPVGVRDYSLADAVTAEIINAQLVGWDVPTRSYYYSVAPAGQLLPFRAYWVRALKDCSIIIPPNRASQSLISRAAKPTEIPAIQSGQGWRVRLAASVAGDRDSENYLGEVNGASNTEDRYDIPKPPTGPSHADLRFIGTDKRGRKVAYALDMRPATTGKQKAEWTMAVGATKGDTDVTLTWDGLGNLPSRAQLTLKDTVTGKVIPMNARSSYIYKNTEAGATRLFTVSLTTQNSAGPLQIRNIRTVSAGGRGQQKGVNVRFALSQDADVQATIQTLTGKVVSVLSGASRGVAQGDVLLRWDGRSREGSEVASGPYVLEITARTDSGEVTTVKRPIAYLQ